MDISAELSMYPLDANYKPPIIDFIMDLREHAKKLGGVEIVTNQLSTQLRGEFAAVTGILNLCMEKTMQEPRRVIFTVKYLNVGLDIAQQPALDVTDEERQG